MSWSISGIKGTRQHLRALVEKATSAATDEEEKATFDGVKAKFLDIIDHFPTSNDPAYTYVGSVYASGHGAQISVFKVESEYIATV